MKQLNYLHPSIYVAESGERGRGVFAKENIGRRVLIEVAPVIVMSGTDRLHIDQSLLHDYIFEWGKDSKQCAMALGYVPLYNHQYRSNCEYEMDFEKQLIRVKTVKAIKAGEELYINYGGDWNNERPVWFDTN